MAANTIVSTRSAIVALSSNQGDVSVVVRSWRQQPLVEVASFSATDVEAGSACQSSNGWELLSSWHFPGSTVGACICPLFTEEAEDAGKPNVTSVRMQCPWGYEDLGCQQDPAVGSFDVNEWSEGKVICGRRGGSPMLLTAEEAIGGNSSANASASLRGGNATEASAAFVRRPQPTGDGEACTAPGWVPCGPGTYATDRTVCARDLDDCPVHWLRAASAADLSQANAAENDTRVAWRYQTGTDAEYSQFSEAGGSVVIAASSSGRMPGAVHKTGPAVFVSVGLSPPCRGALSGSGILQQDLMRQSYASGVTSLAVVAPARAIDSSIDADTAQELAKDTVNPLNWPTSTAGWSTFGGSEDEMCLAADGRWSFVTSAAFQPMFSAAADASADCTTRAGASPVSVRCSRYDDICRQVSRTTNTARDYCQRLRVYVELEENADRRMFVYAMSEARWEEDCPTAAEEMAEHDAPLTDAVDRQRTLSAVTIGWSVFKIIINGATLLLVIAVICMSKDHNGWKEEDSRACRLLTDGCLALIGAPLGTVVLVWSIKVRGAMLPIASFYEGAAGADCGDPETQQSLEAVAEALSSAAVWDLVAAIMVACFLALDCYSLLGMATMIWGGGRTAKGIQK